MASDQRKADTRRKIELGGLIIKAGLGSADAMALLGLLIEHKHTLDDAATEQRLRAVGRVAATKPNLAIATDVVA